MFPFLRTVELAFARFQKRGDAASLAIVFDRTAPVVGAPVWLCGSQLEFAVRVAATTGADGGFDLGPTPRGKFELVLGPLESPRPLRTVVVHRGGDAFGDIAVPR